MNAKKKALFVCSGGGHLVELLEVKDAFNSMEKHLAIYAKNRIVDDGVFDAVYPVALPLSVPGLFRLFVDAFTVLRQVKPAVIVSSGSEITIPFFYIGKLFGARLIYIESCTQVTSPSITGRIVNPVTDLFLVQWEQIAGKYLKKARYAGSLL